MTKRVLIIEDEEAIRELARACLEDLGGWEVFTTGSGFEGLLKAETTSLDAILLDFSMPEMDGWRFCEKLRQNSALQHLPVILLTARVLPADRAQFARMDVAGVIDKPFDPKLICGQVAEILQWSL